jgi:hypothetical protein
MQRQPWMIRAADKLVYHGMLWLFYLVLAILTFVVVAPFSPMR